MTMMIVLLKKQLDNEQRQTGGCSWVLTASGTIYLDNEMDSIHLCTLYTLINTNKYKYKQIQLMEAINEDFFYYLDDESPTF